MKNLSLKSLSSAFVPLAAVATYASLTVWVLNKITVLSNPRRRASILSLLKYSFPFEFWLDVLIKVETSC